MNRTPETRLQRLEHQHAPPRPSHEDWLALLDREPAEDPMDATALDAQIEAEALAEFGSLEAAAVAARAKAKRTGEPFDAFLAADMEQRAKLFNEVAGF